MIMSNQNLIQTKFYFNLKIKYIYFTFKNQENETYIIYPINKKSNSIRL